MPYDSKNPWGAALQNWGDYFQSQADQSWRLPQVQYNYDPSQQMRNYQDTLIQSLQAQATGSRETQAQNQLGAGFRSALAQQSSLGSSARGLSSGAAMRGIGQRQAAVRSELPGQQQMLQLQEQQAAQALLQQLMEQQRQQDFSDAENRAQTALAQQDMLNRYRQSLMGAGIEGQSAQQGRLLDSELASKGLNLERQQMDRQFMQDLMGGGAAALGTVSSYMRSNNNNSPRYRRVGDQDSIVPEWDK